MAIHLFNPMWDASGGSEWRTISLFQLLADVDDVSIWSEYKPDASLLGWVPIRDMMATRSFPVSGTFVFVGAYWDIGQWLKRARPDRVVLVYNVLDPPTLEVRIAQLEAWTGRPVELVFASELMKASAGRPGMVEASPIDLHRFHPAKLPKERLALGRHSRDVAIKHHPNDPAIYQHALDRGCAVRLLGATCTAAATGAVEVLPAMSIPADEFLRGLDIFFYRTSPEWTEPFGRVVAEAMACGLPCLVENRGGYTSLIRQGENGLLFDSQTEAIALLDEMIRDEAMRHRLGMAARESIVNLYNDERRKSLDFYLRR